MVQIFLSDIFDDELIQMVELYTLGLIIWQLILLIHYPRTIFHSRNLNLHSLLFNV